MLLGSVGDPDPQDPHVFGPAGSGSGSISQRYGSGSFPFLINVLSRLKNACNPDLDLLVRGTDPGIHTKMPRIRKLYT
jgi:hypothetical protein